MSNVKEEPCRAGAIRPDAKKIRELREAKGWSQEQLAGEAGHGRRTVENIEQGKCCYLFTLKNLATTLGVDVLVLCLDKPTATPEKRVEVQIVVRIPYGDFDQSEQLTGMVAAIMALLKGGAVDVLKVGSGSTVITLTMSPEDAEQFLRVLLAREKKVPGDLKGAVSEEDVELTKYERLPPPLSDIVKVTFPEDDALDERMRGWPIKLT